MAAAQLESRVPGRLKIAQVATTSISIRILLLEHIRALAAAGHQVTAICAPGEHLEPVRAAGVRVIPVEMTRGLSPLRDLRARQALAECFRRERFDVVHSHTPKAGLLAPLAARRARVPVIVHTIHGLLFHDRQPRWRQWLLRWPEAITARASQHLLAQSREDISAALRARLCPPEKIEYLGNGVDVQRFAPADELRRRAARARLAIAPQEFVLGAVGRLVRGKGFPQLFAAAERVKAQHPRARFLVIAPEDRESSDAIPAQRLRPLAARNIIQFLPWQDDMADCYAAMDAFLLPSHREGIPRAAMEAAACGLPVIASDIRGCREVVEHETTGLLTPLKDASALAQAIESLLVDPAHARRLGENGRRHIAANFDQRQVLARLCSFYERISAQLCPAAAAVANMGSRP